MTKTKVPIVAIVGRANVGKSSLFNAALGEREAIVADEAGTTRDSIYGKASVYDKDFWLVDTAGLKTAEDDFEFTIQEQIVQAASAADIIIVMIEAHITITEEDRRVATMALKTRKPVILAVNKADKTKDAAPEDYLKLGIKDIFLTSTTQGMGIEELLEHVANQLPKASINEDSNRIHLAILGRPNVGKSQLFNALAKKQQAIVADKAGTTRDINRTTVKYMTREIVLMDTAGIRRSGKIERGVEKFSVIRSLSAIEQADICLLLIDANESSVQLDQKIAGMVKETHKGLILILSKWDSVDKDAFTHDKLTPQVKADFDFVPWAPMIVTSSVTGHNVSKIFDLVMEIAQTRQERVKTTELNTWMHKTTDRHPPAGLKNRQPKLRYIVQEEGMPMPSFKIFGSQLKFLHWSYRRHLERTFRETFGYEGTGIKFWYIDQHKPRVHGTKRED
ncbi:ribosome biogenesis GTPase Der [Candidatus Saccharibacteria bacterium]|nr:ribosome biogenesis GTPase Der [Candidatus Saccharibacteria bacterium]